MFKLISRDHAPPMYKIFICKHPAATKRHTPDRYVCHRCHRPVKGRLKHFFMEGPFLVLASSNSTTGDRAIDHSHDSTGFLDTNKLLDHP